MPAGFFDLVQGQAKQRPGKAAPRQSSAQARLPAEAPQTRAGERIVRFACRLTRSSLLWIQ